MWPRLQGQDVGAVSSSASRNDAKLVVLVHGVSGQCREVMNAQRGSDDVKLLPRASCLIDRLTALPVCLLSTVKLFELLPLGVSCDHGSRAAAHLHTCTPAHLHNISQHVWR